MSLISEFFLKSGAKYVLSNPLSGFQGIETLGYIFFLPNFKQLDDPRDSTVWINFLPGK